MRRRESLPGFRLCLAVACVVTPSCNPTTDVVEASAGSASRSPEGALTALFADRTEKFYTGEIQLADLLDLAEPILRMERGEQQLGDAPGPWVQRALTVPEQEAVEAQLVTLPVTPEGVREVQLQIHGPVTSGPFFADAERRNLTISFGYDAQEQPLFCVGLLQDTIARTPDAFWIYQNLPAAPVGGAYKIGRTEEDSYWRPITLRAELREPAPEAAEDWPGQMAAWEYMYGARAPAAPGQLSDLERIRELLD